MLYLTQLVMLRCSFIQGFQILETKLLKIDKNTSNDLLVIYGFRLQPVWHNVVNVLYKDDVGVNLVQILNEGPVSARTEQQ